MLTRITVAAAMSMSLSACFIDTSDSSEVVGESEAAAIVEPIPGRCQSSTCGLNMAKIAGEWFHELSESNVNDQGILFGGLESPTGEYLRVVGDEIQRDDGTAVDATTLEGARLTLVTYENRRAIMHSAFIADVQLVDYLDHPGRAKVPFFEIRYGTPEQPLEETSPICRRYMTSLDPVAPATYAHATLFTGERYDLDERTITETGSSEWITVACAGTPMARLQLMRCISASQPHAVFCGTPTLRQRAFRRLLE